MLFLSAFHQDAGGSNCGYSIKNLKDGNHLTFSRVKTASSTNNPAVEEERMRLTAAGDLALNHTSAIVVNGHTPKLSVQGNNFSESTVSITANGNDGNGAYLFFVKQRSGAAGGVTSVVDGDMIGQFRYLAGDGTDTQSEVANITVKIEGTTGSNDTPGSIRFATTNDGGNTATERMRIRQNGEVVFGSGINPGVTETFLVETGGTIRRRYSTSSGFGIHFTNDTLMPTRYDGAYYNGTGNLGASNYRWGTIFAATGTINTSDRNVKNTITTSDLGLDFINQLKPVSYKFNDGTSGRTHYGLISQDVETVLTDIGKTGTDFAGFCKDRNFKIENDAEGNDVKTELDGYNYSLRYEEFISPLIKAVQELKKENDDLKTLIKNSSSFAALKSAL